MIKIPEELKLELSSKFKADMQVYTVLKEDLEGYGDINEILMFYWKRYGVVLKRTKLNTRLHMMTGRYVEKVTGRRGCFKVMNIIKRNEGSGDE